VNEPIWLNNYELFVKELLVNFSLYDMMADAKVELEQLFMKDNHKATKFFVNLYWLASLLQYNDKVLYQRVNSCERSCSLPSKSWRMTSQTSPAWTPIRIRLAHPTCTQTQTWTPTPTQKRRRSPRPVLHSQIRLTIWTNLVRMVNSHLRNAKIALTTSSV